MKVLLTGGAGYVGSHAAVALTCAGHEVVLADSLCNSSEDVVGRLEEILGKRPRFEKIDIRETGRLALTMRDEGVAAVIHLAGLKAVSQSVADPLMYYEGNVSTTISLLAAMRGAGVKTLVFSSSATVYGDPQYLPFDEDHPTCPVNPYGRTKLHIEEMLADVAQADPEWRIACLRYFNPVGAHDSGLIGEEPLSRPDNLMPYIARVAAGELPQLDVFGKDYETEDGTGVRDFVHVMDVAEGHVAALDFLDAQGGWHAFNLGTGQGRSVLEVVKAFEIASDRPIPIKIAPRRAGDLPAYFADARKAGARLGWTATRSLAEMCSSAWKFQSERRGLFKIETKL